MIRECLGFLSFRILSSPVSDADELADFLIKRSSHVSQVTLYTYLKARMGTDFRRHFEDEVFGKEIRKASLRLFCSCLHDLIVFSTFHISKDVEYKSDNFHKKICFQIFENTRKKYFEFEKTEFIVDLFEVLSRDLDKFNFDSFDFDKFEFSKSVESAVRFSPVIDDFKNTDGNIIKNSIRMRFFEVKGGGS